MITLEEFRSLPVDWDVFEAVDNAVYWAVGDAEKEAAYEVVPEAVSEDVARAEYWAMLRAVDRAVFDVACWAVYRNTSEDFEKGFSRD